MEGEGREREKERDESAFAYEIKWRIYTVRSQYTYVRPTVNYTVNRGVLFERRGKEGSARGRTRRTRRIEGRRVREGGGEEGEEQEDERDGATEMHNDGQVYGARDDLRDDS